MHREPGYRTLIASSYCYEPVHTDLPKKKMTLVPLQVLLQKPGRVREKIRIPIRVTDGLTVHPIVQPVGSHIDLALPDIEARNALAAPCESIPAERLPL